MLSLSLSSTPNDGQRRSQCPKMEDHGCESGEILADPDVVRGLLLHPDPYKSMSILGSPERSQVTER